MHPRSRHSSAQGACLVSLTRDLGSRGAWPRPLGPSCRRAPEALCRAQRRAPHPHRARHPRSRQLQHPPLSDGFERAVVFFSFSHSKNRTLPPTLGGGDPQGAVAPPPNTRLPPAQGGTPGRTPLRADSLSLYLSPPFPSSPSLPLPLCTAPCPREGTVRGSLRDGPPCRGPPSRCRPPCAAAVASACRRLLFRSPSPSPGRAELASV